MKKFFKKTEGFTLVELIVVIAILGILAGVGTVGYSGYIKKANEAADNQLLAALNQAYTAACMENGEYDMKNLSFNPEITTDVQESIEMNKYDDAFQKYYAGGGAFKYFDTLYFVKTDGVFKGNTVAAIEEALKKAVEGTPFDDEDVMGDMMDAFDKIGGYFGNGFSLDALVSGGPAAGDLVEVFSFGTFDMTEEEILEMYCPEYAALTTPEAKAAWIADSANENTIKAVKGNAYVMRFANDAASRSAETIKGDVSNLLNALKTPTTDQDVLDYYNSLPGVTPTTNINDATEYLDYGYGINAYMVVALANSGAKNTSGVSTLGSMYALAAGYFNSDIYKNSADFDAGYDPDFSTFNPFMNAAGKASFATYLESQAEKDIDAYLNAMNYLSTGKFDMENSNMFAGDGLGYIGKVLGFTNN